MALYSPVFSLNTLEYPIAERLHKLTGLGLLDEKLELKA
jgi:hypothetical protein